jgi:hypothetical protein
MKVRIELELTEVEALALAGRAYSFGWKREEPRKRWREPELKEAARAAVQGMVKELVNRG